MTNKINIIIEMPNEVSAGACSGLACVADELAFRHLILDVWTGQVHRQHDE